VANNSATGSIDIVAVNDFNYYAQAFSDVVPYTSGYDQDHYFTSNQYTRYYNNHYRSVGMNQSAYLNAWMPVEVSFPLTAVRMAQATNGAVVHSKSLSGVPADWRYESSYERQACTSLPTQEANGLVWFTLCSGRYAPVGAEPVEWTNLGYQRYGGHVTYWSNGYDHIYYATGEQYHYSWNHNGSESYPFVAYGADYTFAVEIDDGGTLYRTNPTVALMPYEHHFVQPYTCYVGSDAYASWRDCWGSFEHRRYVVGYRSGVPGSE